MLLRVLPALAVAAFASCSGGEPVSTTPGTQSSPPELHSPSYDEGDLVAGQTVYVPVYSHVYQDRKKRPFNLVATLSVRNTDLAHPIRVVSVRYYSSRGELIRTLLDTPHNLAPLASTDFAVDEHDDHGSGTSFIVEWVASQQVHEPVIEAVMISTALSQGLSFTSRGHVIRTLFPPNPDPE